MRETGEKHLEFLAGDLISLEMAHLLMVFANHRKLNEELLGHYLELGILLLLILIAVIFFTDGYVDILKRGYLKEIQAVIHQMAILFAIETVFLFAFEISDIFSRSILFATFFVGILFLFMERILIKLFLRMRFRQTRYARTLMIIATEDQARILARRILDNPLSIFKLVGIAVVDKDLRGTEICGIPVSACRERIGEFVGNHVVDEVLISIPGDGRGEVELASQFLSIGLVAHICMESYYQELPNRTHNTIGSVNVLTCCNRQIPLWMPFCKRAMDLAGGLVGTALALAVGIAVGPLIYMKSPGPVIFSQIRVGRNGRRFRMYKFRSMYLDAEERKKELLDRNEMQGNMFKIEDDPRILPGIGQFIRRTSLDEFPQFFNVLRGDMSLVGTRPPTVDEYEKYSFYQNKRLAMKPGITGVWQISGRSEITDFDQVVRMDSEYIDSWTIEKDIKILIKTVAAVWNRKGSR